MLKIKDNVDLKELEKFGFEKDRLSCYYIKEVAIAKECVVYTDTNAIWFVDNGTLSQLDIIFDLIQAGLVEKVVE